MRSTETNPTLVYNAPARHTYAGVRRKEKTAMPDSTIITDVEHNYSVRIPHTTPSGQPVEIVRSQQEGMHGMHAHSPDASEVYFEVVSYPGRIGCEEAVTGQRDSLASRSPDAALTPTKQSVVRGFDATEFRFEGTLDGQWKVRRFIFLDTALRTYRVICDPRFAANEEILGSLVFETAA
jgi:hypothetical protein